MIEVCNRDRCTGCSACADICPKNCIVMNEDCFGALYPHIDPNSCINCGCCQKVCPSLNTDDQNPRSEQVFAAWSKDNESRNTSASGAIASELYKYALSSQIHAFGVVFERDKGAYYIEVKNSDDILRVKNSKYVYSNAQGVYKRIKQLLLTGRKVLFIGLPCQVAALKHFTGNMEANLFTVDIICHGVAPTTFLLQHIDYLEKKKHKIADTISFRDPLFNTYTFTFTLKNRGKVFYKSRVKSRDVYQLGYHRALIYRNNCYHCRFACDRRVGDITIGDYSGLGRMGGYDFPIRNVNGFICNTRKGMELMKLLQIQCVFVPRPSEEIFKYEKQLQHPSIPHEKRAVFLAKYLEKGQFESSARFALRKDIVDATLRKGEWKSISKSILRWMIPQFILDKRKK